MSNPTNSHEAVVIPMMDKCPDPKCQEGVIEKERWEEGVGDYAVMVICDTCGGSGKVSPEQLAEYLEEN